MTETDLHDYQRACVKHIVEHPYCGVFLDMGLGKTVSTLTAIEALKFDCCEIDTVLVVAPKRVVESVWQEEAEKWDHLRHLRFSKITGSEKQRVSATKEKADVYIISRDNISWLCARFGGLLPYDMVVVDELSSFKSHKAVRWKALRGARAGLKRFVGLTGTPAPNGLIDLWPQMYLIDRGERLGKTISLYRHTYFKPGKTNGHVVYSYSLLSGSEQRIREKVSDICISMRAEDYLRLPERSDNFIRLKLPEPIKKEYDRFERDRVIEMMNALGDTGTVTAVNAAALSNKLLQFANGCVYGENGNIHPVHDIKIEALKEIVEGANGQPVLVAWTFRFDRARIMDALKAYGPRDLKESRDIDDWNEGKVQVMLAHPASAGHGLNLQAGGSIIVWYGLTWSLELYQQFNARLYRQGQTSRVIVHHLVMDGTHDRDVVAALKSKNERQNAFMDSIKAKIKRYVH